ncbi:dTMP kinase [Thermomonospora curvata]|uniref:Thymidylate kinase n=1 Tax=Thermomonospora curvata (strain ATCC 19995 / DSM 43183 / JCM 3096 / KCTC 9072 / NBRC 15933 / NCIMB 10081 / Henssen B9) TaxID=471852 RepID=D1A586_THECD|nr:dTMP kinase [Thermomonospora curvata]ACZ00072.1 thymidylate kinase [Thermomonospora curvata DSM 43183]
MTRTGAAEPDVLSIKPLRRLWLALSLAGLGDWLSLLALTALAWALTSGEGYAVQSLAVGGALLCRVLPAALPPGLAAAAAVRLDRRTAMISADVLRAALLVTVPLIGQAAWLMVAALLVGCLSVLWRACAEAVIDDLVPPGKAQAPHRRAARIGYGAAPVAALLLALLALAAQALLEGRARADLPAYATAAVFLLSIVAVFAMGAVPAAPRPVAPRVRAGRTGLKGLRGLTAALAGVLAAGGAVAGVARIYVAALGGGDAGFGALLGAAFTGTACGLLQGPRLLGDFSRRRLLGLTAWAAGAVTAALALIHNLVVVVVLAGLLGWACGVAWATARTLVHTEAEEEDRAPAQAFLQALARAVLPVTLAAAPLLAGVIGEHTLRLTDEAAYSLDGVNVVLLAVALVTLLIGLVAHRALDDRRGVPLGAELAAALRGVPYTPPEAAQPAARERGVFIAFEGGEGAGKTTQARLTAIWLRDHGYDVVTTNEPGATKVGMRLRAILLDKETTGLSARAETLLYAADRANHVANVIKPALERGAIVVSDRYVDSSLAYQGYGRELPVEEIAEVNRWATDGLQPDLTVLLDLPPQTGLGRFASPADRMESEPLDFHERVRRGFRKLAEADPDRYLVLDATRPQEELSRQIRDRLRQILPDPIPPSTEDITSTFPAIAD